MGAEQRYHWLVAKQREAEFMGDHELLEKVVRQLAMYNRNVVRRRRR